MLRLAREARQVPQRLVDAAALLVERFELVIQPLGRGKLAHAATDVPGEPLSDLERAEIARQAVLLQQPRQQLVQRVVRRPHRRDRLEPVEEARGEGRDIAGAVGRRQIAELIDHLGHAVAQLGVARGGEGHRRGREPVAEEVAAQLGARVLPAHEAKRSRLPLAPVGGEPPREQQRVGREQLEVLQVGLERGVEGAARRQADVGQRHRLDRERGRPRRRGEGRLERWQRDLS